jgi:hypothetical protein
LLLIAAPCTASHGTSARKTWIAGPCDGVVHILFTIEVRACKPWLESEIAIIKPRLVVALGATAAQSLLGSSLRLMANRGLIFSGRPRILATIHPSAILRDPDGEGRRAQMSDLVRDLEIPFAMYVDL